MKLLRNILLTTSVIVAFAAAGRAAPKTMTVLSSAAYDSGSLDDSALALTTDSAGNVFLTGASGDDYLSMKYSKTLAQGPAVLYTNSRSGNIPGGIAVDGLGNIIVVGMETNASSKKNYLVLKYSSNFAGLISSATYDGGTDDIAVAVKIDSQDNIYVTGYSDDAGNVNFYTIKYNSALVRVSSAVFDSGDLDQAAAMVLNGEDVIVAGVTKVGGSNDNFRVVRYDSNLKELRTVDFDSGGGEKIAGVAVDSSGNIIATGRQIGVTADFLTVKYDSFLNLISSAVYDSGTNDIPTGITVDSADNIIVTGYTGPGTVNDYFTIKYDSNFNVISSAAYNGGNTDRANAVAVDGEDNIIVTGQSFGVNYDYFTVKYNASPKLTDVPDNIYIGETTNVTFKGYGLVSGSSVAFSDPGISTGTISVISGQITLSVTPAASVMLGVTTVTVTAANGEEVVNTSRTSTRLRKIVPAGQSETITALTKQGQVTVAIPAGAFQYQETVIIYTVPAPAGNPNPVGEALYLEVSPADVPQDDVYVTMHYDPADLGETPESSLSLAYYSTSSVWVPLTASVVDTAGNSVRAPTSFVNTKFAVVKEAQGSGGGGAGGSGIPAKVYPNPYRPGSGGNFDQSTKGEGIVFAGLGAWQTFKLTIVDLAGQLVYQKSAAADNLGEYLWDTKTVSGGKAASGVYLYLIKGSGKPQKGKFSIIR